MTTGVEYVREACKKRGVTVAQLEKELGFSNGYLNPKKLRKIPYDRAKAIAVYLEIDLNRILGEDETGDENIQHHNYYTNETTARMAEDMATNPELRALYDVQRDMDPEDLQALYNMALALKRKAERTDMDDPC